MGDRHDYVALEWVKGEIAETLKRIVNEFFFVLFNFIKP